MEKLKTFWSKYGSNILTGVSITCHIATPILVAIETPKAIAAVKEAEQLNGRPLTPIDMAKASWKHYIIPGAVATVGIAADIANNSMNAATIANLSTMYNDLIDNAAKFEKAVESSVSKQKLEEIHEKSTTKQPELCATSNVIKETGYGDALFIDKRSGQVFRSSIEKIRSVENSLNEILFNGHDVHLAEYYTLMGLRQIDTDCGWKTGWSLDQMYDNGQIRQIKIIITHTEQLDDGTPVGIIEFGADSRPKFFR